MAMVAKSALGTAVSDITILMCRKKHTGRFAARQTRFDDLHSACIIFMEELVLNVLRIGEAVQLSLLEILLFE